MVATRATVAPILTPQQVSDLLIKPLILESVAMQVSKVVETSKSAYRIPIIEADPSAGWVDEGQEIAPSDAVFFEKVIQFRKLASLVAITREAAEDTSPEATEAIGDGFKRDFSRKIDAAFFGTVAGSSPGLGTLTGFQTVETGTPANQWDNLDAFAEASAGVENLGHNIGAFVTSPAIALGLATLKSGTGSNVPLLATDPAQPSRRLVNGVPLLVSSSVAANTVWGVPSGLSVIAVREDVSITSDTSVFYTSDRVALRATMRIGFGFPFPGALVKIVTEAAA